jgi:large subunit ribosomal protein L21
MSATAFQRLRREQEAARLLELEKTKPKSLAEMKVADLKEIAKEKGIEGFDNMTKAKLLEAIKNADEAAADDHGEGEENKNLEGAE